jgi:methionine-rich copper-binding protein CopC
MKGASVFLGGVWLVAALSAQAHAHLQQVTPADGSVLEAAPAQLVLRFSEAAQLTSLTIVKDGGAQQKVTPLPQKPQAQIVVALPPLAAGHYVLSWRVLSADGHVMPGQVHFTLGR